MNTKRTNTGHELTESVTRILLLHLLMHKNPPTHYSQLEDCLQTKLTIQITTPRRAKRAR